MEHTIEKGTLDELRAAVRADPANARLAAHFGRRLADFFVDERARAEADFQTRRAAKLAPDKITKLRAEVAKLTQLSNQ